jgi:DNA polymerase III gamma/tau subunit
MNKETRMTQSGYNDWYIKDRPTSFDQVVGQTPIVKYYKNCQKTDSWPKVSFFMGKFGLGKSTLAKIIAMNLACKSRDEKTHEPCGVCPSCRSIIDETWDRDVLNLNGTKMSAQDIRDALAGFKATLAFRDRNKVLIIDETQDLSPEGVNSILELAEAPGKGQYIILNAMGKLKGSLGGALESRTKKWKLREPPLDEVYLYLIQIAAQKGLVDPKTGKSIDKKIPDEFWLEPLRRVVENSENSYRKAIQLLEQAIDGELWTVKELNETLDFGSYDEMLTTVEKLSMGHIDETVLDTITGSKYQDDFNLIYKIVSDAEVCRVIGRLSSDDSQAWKARQPKQLAASRHFPLVRDTMVEIARRANGFLRRGDWQICMSQLVERIRTADPPGVTETPKAVARRPVK